ncbi:hypothetical protein P378_04335 [Desulforamulus profundi]|uniref:Uncharacterized protein n=1 Tax=Desulforamulus profundi TaxID=1383067 RepID=A0A2C6MIJ2_9FIRM|nr:hypothetical protein P378_04335 [Desulforamulus profundi]
MSQGITQRSITLKNKYDQLEIIPLVISYKEVVTLREQQYF